MYILGKKNRSLMHRHNILKILGLTDKPIPGKGDTLVESRAGLRRMKVRQENVEWNEKMRRGGEWNERMRQQGVKY